MIRTLVQRQLRKVASNSASHWPGRLRAFGIAALLVCTAATTVAAEGWKAGAAKVVITPEKLMWMSGYASRNHPAEGKQHDLWAKALVVEDGMGNRAALVTLDLVGIDRDVSAEVRDRLEKQYALKRHQVALNASHTHSGPVVGRNLKSMYFFDEAQWTLVDQYTTQLIDKLVSVVGKAIENLAPATLAWGHGQATFAVNRRNNREAEVPELRKQNLLKGPSDHDVPVLSVTRGDGELSAVVFGYACHATVMGFYKWCGDYPGFAQLALEERHPGTVALFFAGCGGDQNPLPRKEIELAEQYGQRLAQAVDEALASQLQPLKPVLESSYSEVALPFDRLPDRAELEAQAKSSNRYEASRGKMLLEQINAGKPLSPSYPYPVQFWRLGEQLQWITLGGEVVVDYALRLKQELGPERTWVAGYTNDVMAYIPSRRVLAEGGYEGGGAMLYYGLPTIWAPQVEKTIVEEVHRQAASTGGK